MLSLIDRLIGAVVGLFSARSNSMPAVQRVPVRNHASISRRLR